MWNTRPLLGHRTRCRESAELYTKPCSLTSGAAAACGRCSDDDILNSGDLTSKPTDMPSRLYAYDVGHLHAFSVPPVTTSQSRQQSRCTAHLLTLRALQVSE
jgi:hypothetical protein